MASFHPYLNFEGNTEEAFNFYKSVFGGDFVVVQRFSDTPAGSSIPAEDQNKIMHISLKLGNSGTVLMGTDALKSMGHTITKGDNFSISIMAESEEEADSLFNALSAGGKVSQPMQKMFWNAYFGMFTDKFGIQWMVNFDYAPHTH